MAQPKQYKLKFKPTPISRLSKWKIPIPMKGDPKWWDGEWRPYNWKNAKEAWRLREQAVWGERLTEMYKTRDLVTQGSREYEEIQESRELVD